MSNLTKITLLAAGLFLLTAAGGFFSLWRGSDSDSSDDAPSNVAEASQTDQLIASLQATLTETPDDSASLTNLGFAYLQKARESADPTFYTKAEEAFVSADGIVPDHPSTTIGLSAVAQARHDFDTALVYADEAAALSPRDPDVHGARGDALIELGRYDDALAAFQQMVDLRPDLASYSRVSYARELHGDVPGAIEAMRMAVQAGGREGENSAFVRVQLGHLYFYSGDFEPARASYESALDAFPGYIHATAGLARLAASEGDYDEAIALYTDVTTRVPVAEYVIALGDVYAAAGRPDDAQAQYDLVGVIDELARANGVNTDAEIAVFFADHGIDLTRAVEQARAVYAESPSIASADALAWSLYAAGDLEDASTYASEATRLGTEDPRILFHAGMIEYRLGNAAEARAYLERVDAANPAFSVLHGPQLAEALSELNAAVSQ